MLGSATFLLLTSLSAPAAAAKREQPDYGAPRPATTPGEVALWVPRVVLRPAFWVSEYAVRRPVGAFVSYAEREQLPARLKAFFTFGDRDQIELFPSALFDFGVKPSIGFNLSWRYFVAERSTLRAHFGHWGTDWIGGKISEEYELGKGDTVAFDANVLRRGDWVYTGLGPLADAGMRYRYQATNLELGPSAMLTPLAPLHVSTRLGMRGRWFGAETCCGTSVQNGIDSGRLVAPPGWKRDFIAAFQSLSVELDTRGSRPESQTGALLRSHVDAEFVPRAGDERRGWLQYGAVAAGAIDLWNARTISFGVSAELVDPLVGDVPFTDLVALGGERAMRGYLQGSLRDRSSLVSSLRYSWPVWVFLDGAVQVEVGNVFGRHFEGFDADKLRLSTSIGLRSTGDPDSAFELLLAGGTDAFGDGLPYSNFRLVFGSHHAF